MRYQHPDLDEITVFLQGIVSQLTLHAFMADGTCEDFGMQIAKRTAHEIWYRGYGTDQYVYYARKGEKKFLGGTFEVETYDDLRR